ncbi:adipocyte plasma membrane-associated protein-like [Mercenaria mercenaria]|uniref:adipocyte plasma membrane-associated protein-like n=1 Tax=Mercenaria mercenaria TaxID=6596 RepID=UPI00234E9243|nr:adipocyte plasma membrane-associated protein-like [Mercenaria mercenaria]
MKSESAEINTSASPQITWTGRQIFLVALLPVITCLLFVSSPIDPLPYTFPSPLPRLEAGLKKNTLLQQADRWFEGLLIGPESFAADTNGTIYTGTADGRIFSIKQKGLSLVARTGIDHPQCGSAEFEPRCGRPKGMKIGPDGKLYVVDSYKGLLKVDLDTGDVETVVSNKDGSEGVPFRFLNSMDISSDGIIYFTDSSNKWERRDFRYAVLETRPDGRVIRYDIRTGICRTLLSGLYLANGIALTADEDALLIAEMSIARIRRFYLKGEKAGTSDIFVDNLPGYPDNIKLNTRGNFYVGSGSVRFKGSSPIGSFLDLIGPYPSVKKVIAAVTPLSAYNVFMPKHALVVEINIDGLIVGSLHDPGVVRIGAASEAFEFNGTVFIGHYQSPYLGVLSSATINAERSA